MGEGSANGRHDLGAALAGVTLTPVVRFLASTWSIRVINRRILEEYFNRRRPLVLAVWHQAMIPTVAFFRDRRAFMMVSRSRDGEMITRVGRRLGLRSVRGSSSNGGAQALQESVAVLRRGGQLGIVVDGPRGPAREPKIGVVVAARDSGAPIIPFACVGGRRTILAQNWDRTLVPLPFAQLTLCFGDPIEVPPDAPPDECERMRLRVREALLRAEKRASGGK